MLAAVAGAALAVAPIPLDYTLPLQTVENPVQTVEENHRISEDERANDKKQADRLKRAKVRRVLFHTVNAADLATTVICLEARDNCKEINPIYGQSTEAVIVGKVAVSVLFEVLRRDGTKAEVAEWLMIGLMTAIVGNNITVVF
jgi:hypothetical protein